MKLKNLLIFGAALLGTGAVSADIVERQKPVFELKTPIEAPTDGVTYAYMYNVGAKKFFTGANYWGTHSSVGEFENAYKVTFKQYVAAGADWDGFTVEFLDSCIAKSNAVKNVFIDNVGGSSYVDKGNQANYYWNLAKNADNAYYRLSMGVASPNYQEWQVDTHPETYFGNNDTLKTTDANNNATPGSTTLCLAFLDPANPHVHVDWAFVSLEEGGAFEALLDIYNESEILKGLIADAQTKGVPVTDAEAVYNNASATVEDIQAACVAVRKAIAQYDMMNVDPSNPDDKTSLLANPDYTDGKTGWTDSNSDWAVSYNVAEHYNDVFDHYQKLENIPSGVWAVTLRGYCRPISAASAFEYYNQGLGHGVVVYGISGTDTIEAEIANIWAGASEAELGVGTVSQANDAEGKTWYVTNNMQGAEAYFNDEVLGPKYDVTLFFGVEADSMQLGIKQETLIGEDWVLWDNWRLKYYGGKAEAYQMWLDNLVANAPKYDEDVLATDGMVDEYNAVVARVTTASTYAEVVAVQKAINEAAAVLDANIAAWAAYSAKVSEGLALAAREDLAGQYVEDLADYCELEAEDVLNAMGLTTEEVIAEAAKLEEMMELAKKYSYSEGSDVTDLFLVNADFSQGAGSNPANVPGWNGNWTNVSSQCMEGYAITFDAWQEVKDAGVGIYEVSLQGFFRIKRDQEAYNLYTEGQQICPAHVYVNNNKSGMKCVFDEPVPYNTLYTAADTWSETPDAGDPEYWYPNTMLTAGEAFTAGMYQASANGLVAKEGDVLRLGVKGELPADTWAIWDNFRMIYWGKRAGKVQPYLSDAIVAGEANLQDNAMAKDVRAQVEAAIAGGKAVVEGTDGEAMFDALVALYATNDSIEVSMALFAELGTAAEELYALISASEASAELIAEASVLAGNAMDATETSAITNAEAREMLAQIALYSVKLRLPGDMSAATDDNVIDCTNAISSADFGNTEGANTDKGWSYSAQGSFGNDDTQKAAFAYEYYQKAFDLYQDIPGLPAGTYTLTVDGFSRNGSTENDYALWSAGVEANTTYLYAMTTDSVVYRQSSVSYYSAGASDVNNGYSGEGEFVADGGATVYLPGSMVSAVNYMDELGKYKDNKVVITIAEGQTLRIGMKKAEYISNDWVIMDNWKLFYHGTNSSAEGIEEVAVPSQAAVVKVQVYGLNGVQMSGLQKGLNIVKTTLEDGTVIVKKAFVK